MHHQQCTTPPPSPALRLGEPLYTIVSCLHQPLQAVGHDPTDCWIKNHYMLNPTCPAGRFLKPDIPHSFLPQATHKTPPHSQCRHTLHETQYILSNKIPTTLSGPFIQHLSCFLDLLAGLPPAYLKHLAGLPKQHSPCPLNALPTVSQAQYGSIKLQLWLQHSKTGTPSRSAHRPEPTS